MLQKAGKVAGQLAIQVAFFAGMGYVMGVGEEYGRRNTSHRLDKKSRRKNRRKR